jgi:electron transfer flavoprotein alpha/beta subunit
MKIVCLVKQVPRPDSIEFDQETKTLRREGVPLILNPFDAAAVAHAAALRERNGGEVIAMTMGPPQAEAALRTCLSLGADRCIHLSDRVFAVADTIGTSRTLALALRREGDVDLVVCGRKTVDSETWQVPPEVAAFLGWPHVTSVLETEVDGRVVRVVRETDDGLDTYELKRPAVLSLAHARETDASGDGRIDVWTAHDLVGEVYEYDKRFGQTGSPTRVLVVRDATPERSGDVFDSVAAAAPRLQALLAERRVDPSQWDKPERLGERPGKSYDCWTLVEHSNGRPIRASLELLGKGRELAGKLGGENVALVLGSDVSAVAREAARHGAERVVVVEDERLATYDPELYAHTVRSVLEHLRPHVLTIPATANGRDVGPRVAGELELGMTGDCVGLGIERAGRLVQTKPAYGGNIVSVIMGSTTPQLATVRPRMFEPLEPRDVEPTIERFDPGGWPEPRLRRTDHEQASARDLDEADVIVCLGAEVEELPELPAGVALGGTREACEAGLLPRSRQIGLLGRQVAPNLLVAVGVRGDAEELTGFVKANVVAAIAADRSAPMLAAADVAVVGDWREVLPSLLEAI